MLIYFRKFGERFQDLKVKELELNIFATPFNIEAMAVPETFNMKLPNSKAIVNLKRRSRPSEHVHAHVEPPGIKSEN